MNNLLQKIKSLEKQILFSFFFGLLISIALAFWSDLQETTETVLSFKLYFIPLALGLSLLNYVLRFLRFKHFLKATNLQVSSSNAFLIFFSGLSMTVTPGKVGELIKAYFLKKVGKNHFASAVPIIVAERLTDGLASIILASFGMMSFKHGLPVFLIGIAICLAIIITLKNEALFLKILSLFWFSKKLIPGFKKFFTKAQVLVSFKNLSIGTLLGSLAWGAECLGLTVVLVGLGVAFSSKVLLASFFIFCFASLLGFLSFLPAGLGVTEGSLTGLLITLLGLSKTLAVSATILLRIFTLWFGVSLGIISLFVFLRKKL
ncbi:flippase-like domain-containing protein [Candidatus Microgenomates bacterium]|nr:flippase-like domain-containing protein [Candidatus Microgenomates bacterium]